MKQGRTLTQLALEIERQQGREAGYYRADRQDAYVARSTRSATSSRGKFGTMLAVGEALEYRVNSIGHDQIGAHAGIPSKYYDRMLAEAPDLLATNVNRWFEKYPAPRLVRTMDKTVRAFLSDSYRPLENFDLAQAVFPVLADLSSKSCRAR
jgi:hypothetical protein